MRPYVQNALHVPLPLHRLAGPTDAVPLLTDEAQARMHEARDQLHAVLEPAAHVAPVQAAVTLPVHALAREAVASETLDAPQALVSEPRAALPSHADLGSDEAVHLHAG